MSIKLFTQRQKYCRIHLLTISLFFSSGNFLVLFITFVASSKHLHDEMGINISMRQQYSIWLRISYCVSSSREQCFFTITGAYACPLVKHVVHIAYTQLAHQVASTSQPPWMSSLPSKTYIIKSIKYLYSACCCAICSLVQKREQLPGTEIFLLL